MMVDNTHYGKLAPSKVGEILTKYRAEDTEQIGVEREVPHIVHEIRRG